MTELIQYVFPSRPTGRFFLRQTTGGGKVYEKEIVKAGTYTYWDGELDFNPDRLRSWVKNFAEMVAAGIELRVYWDHDNLDSRKAVGDIEDLYYDEETEILMARLRIQDDEAIEKIDKELIRHTSPAIGGFADDKGQQWPEAVVEISLVSDPHLRDQGPFIALSAKTKNEGDDVPDNETMRLELKAANEQIEKLKGDIKNSGEVKGLEVKLSTAEGKVTTVEEERDELKTTVETLKEEQFKAKVENKIVELKAANKLTQAEETDVREALTLAGENERAFELAHKPFSDRKSAPTSPSVHAGDTAPTGDEADLKLAAVTEAARLDNLSPEDYTTKLSAAGHDPERIAWATVHKDGTPFPDGGENTDMELVSSLRTLLKGGEK